FGLDGSEAADARAADGAAACRVRLGEVDPGVLDRLDAGGDAVVHELVHAPQLLGIEVAARIEVLHLPAETDRELRHIEPRDRSDATLTGENGLPARLDTAAHGRDQSHAGYDYATLAHKLPISWGFSWGILRRLAPLDRRGSQQRTPQNPVRTARKIAAPELAVRLCSGFVAALVDVLDRLVNRGDLLSVLIRNLDFELFLESHHELDRVERVGSQIVHEGGVIGHLLLLGAKLLGHDGFDLLLNCAH